MMRRSVRPGHNDTNATEPLLARAIRLRATRPRISVEIRLRCATDTPCLGSERFFPNPFNPETPPRHHLERVRISADAPKSGAKSGFRGTGDQFRRPRTCRDMDR